MAKEKLKKLSNLISERDHARDVYDTRSTPENKKRLKDKDDEVKRAMDYYDAAQGKGRPQQSRKWTE